MKKMIAFVLASAMLFALSACSSTEEETAAPETQESVSPENVKSREDMIRAGYIEGLNSGSEGKLAIEFSDPENENFYALGWKMSDEQWEEYMAIDIFEDDAEEKEAALLAEADGPVLVCLNEFIPDFSGCVGKTFTEMEEEGWLYSYMSEEEDGSHYAVFDTLDYQIHVYSDDIPEGIEAYEEALDWSGFVVSKVVFGYFNCPENLVFAG